ncbi:unnamed protein product [marine sediment metagenome]|uniref:Uncharacterized protein n=1 Tax=marine sediment metagenome TaxID=412755 RepID=X1N9E2_9ZZZZ
MKSSGKLDENAIIHTGPCRLLGVTLIADLGKRTDITVYPDISATGTEVVFGRACGGSDTYGSNNFVIKFSRDDNMFCDNGLYATLSAGAYYIIYFEPM